MPGQQFAAIAQNLADLADLPETSFALRAYLKSVGDRDIVDVMNEIEALVRATKTMKSPRTCIE